MVSRKAVFVIGATNYIGKLDSAILRTGRLDSVIYLGMPDEAAILDILKKSLKKSQLQCVNRHRRTIAMRHERSC